MPSQRCVALPALNICKLCLEPTLHCHSENAPSSLAHALPQLWERWLWALWVLRLQLIRLRTSTALHHSNVSFMGCWCGGEVLYIKKSPLWHRCITVVCNVMDWMQWQMVFGGYSDMFASSWTWSGAYTNSQPNTPTPWSWAGFNSWLFSCFSH